ncbi:MAG: hypothetical protein CAPSK01_002972 [Candidatus Accumulibacter vicinus]|uniref:Uncharacterized protein n=1 Tax=Candidatus Accumulibacter vicinus TaxID=2954382 RepID=A0A084XYI7_9PROT|nr:MAG: hypothetical protein CAPSK01_002972 [Candidatus Accumulibacter vicinus]
MLAAKGLQARTALVHRPLEQRGLRTRLRQGDAGSGFVSSFQLFAIGIEQGVQHRHEEFRRRTGRLQLDDLGATHWHHRDHLLQFCGLVC